MDAIIKALMPREVEIDFGGRKSRAVLLPVEDYRRLFTSNQQHSRRIASLEARITELELCQAPLLATA